MNIGGVALVLVASVAAAQAQSRDIVIEHVTVISPERDRPLTGASVVIRDGRILAVGRDVRVPRDARRINGRGRFLIPGLVDSHVHVGTVAALDDDAIDHHPDLVDAYRAQLPRAYLAFGFTTLVDLDDRAEARATFTATPLHPSLYHCGRAVRIPGGYGARRIASDAAEHDYPSLVYEPTQSEHWPRTLDPAQHSPASVVRRIAADGAICVKVFVESGFGMFDWPVPLAATLDSLRAEATRQKLKLVVHATSADAWTSALHAHADVIAHGMWHWPGPRANATPPVQARAVIDSVGLAGIRVQPTLRVLRSEQSLFDWGLLDDPRLTYALPGAMLSYLRTTEAEASRRSLAATYEQAAIGAGESGARALIDTANVRAMNTFRLMRDANVPLIFGSDTPSGEGIGNPPGLNGRLELQHWADAGIPLRQILRAVTLANAEAFGLEREIGSVEPGKRADLLLLSANPLVSIAAYDSIETILLNGLPLPRATLKTRPPRRQFRL